jgi:ribosomal protein L31E
MDSLNAILHDKDFEVPPEIAAIKAYVQRHFQSEVNVKLGPQVIVISTKSASLAGSLRMHLRQLQAAAATDKRLILRIGQ